MLHVLLCSQLTSLGWLTSLAASGAEGQISATQLHRQPFDTAGRAA